MSVVSPAQVAPQVESYHLTPNDMKCEKITQPLQFNIRKSAASGSFSHSRRTDTERICSKNQTQMNEKRERASV